MEEAMLSPRPPRIASAVGSSTVVGYAFVAILVLLLTYVVTAQRYLLHVRGEKLELRFEPYDGPPRVH
jgi:hypothetical protein